MSKNTLISLVFVAVLVAGAGYYIVSDFTGIVQKKEVPDQNDGKTQEITVDEGAENISGVEITTSEGDVITGELVKITHPAPDEPVPDLNRLVVNNENTLDSTIAQIREIQSSLKENSNQFMPWVSLGQLELAIGDYEGARQSWEYVSVIRPENPISFTNLGALYGYYLGNPILAEANFLNAVENDRGTPQLYSQVVDFYLEVMNSPEKAREFLERSIEKYPNMTMLKQLLDSI